MTEYVAATSSDEWVGQAGRIAFAAQLPDQLLTWAPPDTTGYTTINVPTSGYTSTLDHNTDYVFNMPASPVTAPVWIKGGRNVVMIGGEIAIDTINYDANGGANESDQQGIYIIRHPSAGVHGTPRIVHIEGVHIHGYGLSDGIRTALNDGGPADVDLRVQNCRIELGMWYRDSGLDGTGTPHPDVLQPFGGLHSLRVDRLTGLVTGQGLMLKSDVSGGVNGGFMQLKRLNLKENTDPLIEYNDAGATYPNPGRDPRYFWWTDGSEGGVRLEAGTVWFSHPTRTFAGGSIFWPDTGTSGTDGTGTYEEPTDSLGWDGTGAGKVYEGDPPGGDYCPAGTPGTAYTSPGYA